ncbi:Triacylglycerol lipase [Bertholletia excelsa]
MAVMGTRTLLLLLTATIPLLAVAGEIRGVKERERKGKASCVLVFGDSSVDPGNNNRLPLAPKSNFPPYGKDLFHGRPTGRFSNGRLATDFIAEAMGYTHVLPGFLDPTLNTMDLLHGVSFASAGSGYDDLTANLSNALSVSKQLDYFRHYRIHLRQLVGEKKAEKIIRNALFIISMGSNDFLQNYFFYPTRSKQFTLKQYQFFLTSRMLEAVKAMHHMGARRVAVVGIPPLGCIPVVKAVKGESMAKCIEEYNKVALSYNSNVQDKLASLNASLPIRIAFIDIYFVIARAINNPKRYGFIETSKGCCGSGMIEAGDTCKGMSSCADPTKYVFWDAVHPTEHMYKIVAAQALRSLAGMI